MQDEIQDINAQIEKENKKLPMTSDNTRQEQEHTRLLESEIELLVNEMGIQNPSEFRIDSGLVEEPGEIMVASEASSNIGDALRLLAQKKQRIQDTQRQGDQIWLFL